MSTKRMYKEPAEQSCGRKSSKVIVPCVFKYFIIGIERSDTWDTRIAKKVEEGETPNTERSNGKSSEEMLHRWITERGISLARHHTKGLAFLIACLNRNHVFKRNDWRLFAVRPPIRNPSRDPPHDPKILRKGKRTNRYMSIINYAEADHSKRPSLLHTHVV